MRGQRRAGGSVDFELGIAVVGRHCQQATTSKDRLLDPAKLAINHLHRPDGRLKIARVTDHVRIGEVDDDEGVLARRNLLQ